MSGSQRSVSDAPASSVFNLICPAADQAGCSLRSAALNARPRRNGLKESLTECEIEIFLSLARCQHIAVRDHETGATWRGWVDTTFPDHGFVWVITEVGERKLLDIGGHTVWRPDESGHCGRVRREANHLMDGRALVAAATSHPPERSASRYSPLHMRAAPPLGQNPPREPLEPG